MLGLVGRPRQTHAEDIAPYSLHFGTNEHTNPSMVIVLMLVAVFPERRLARSSTRQLGDVEATMLSESDESRQDPTTANRSDGLSLVN